MLRIPTITKNLLIINILAFIAMLVLEPMAGIDLNDICGLHFFKASNFHLYQLVTYMFMHGGWTHIIVNMFMLWMFGAVVENVWGGKRFLFYYIFCGIGAGLCQELVQYIQYISEGLANYESVNIGSQIISMQQFLGMSTTVGASGAIYALLLAFGMMFPNEKMFIIPIPVPIKAKWIVLLSIIVELFSSIAAGGDGVAHTAHLGGMLFGLLLILYWRHHPGQGYTSGGGTQFFNNLRQRWDNRSASHGDGRWQGSRSDWDYNARKKAEQDEVDRILDKIRKSGYDSLTHDEKQTLFEQGKK